MTDRNNTLVAEYLDALAQATADLPPDRRGELLADLREHIAAARAELHTETEAAVRTILDRLGDPRTIAAEARLGVPPVAASAPAASHDTWRTVWRIIAVVVVTVVVVCVGVMVVGLAAYRAPGGDSGDGGTWNPPPPSPRPHSSRSSLPS